MINDIKNTKYILPISKTTIKNQRHLILDCGSSLTCY